MSKYRPLQPAFTQTSFLFSKYSICVIGKQLASMHCTAPLKGSVHVNKPFGAAQESSYQRPSAQGHSELGVGLEPGPAHLQLLV